MATSCWLATEAAQSWRGRQKRWEGWDKPAFSLKHLLEDPPPFWPDFFGHVTGLARVVERGWVAAVGPPCTLLALTAGAAAVWWRNRVASRRKRQADAG